MGMILWLFAIFLIGVPICFSLGFVSLGGVLLNGFPPLVVVQRMFTGADSIALIAIPLFMLAGELMFQGGMSKRMVDFADTLLGHFPSGLAMVNILACMFFAAITGSAIAATAAIGGIMIPLMKEKGYENTFTVSGVYRYEVTGFAANMTGDTTTNIFIPIGAAEQINDDVGGGHYGFQVRANDGVDTKAFAQASEDYFNRRFYRDNDYVMVWAENMDSMVGSMTGMMSTMSLAISVIAAISLLVGGIGVMNIMLVSVTERTREIGTRKALGARNSAIRAQFIVESMIICLIGGSIGVALGTALGRVGSVAIGAPGWPGLGIVLIAVSFSMAIGVFFGFYPANKAAKLDPIEALRYE